MNHPCHCYTCMENLGGQCFAGGCATNPEPERDEDDNETENTQEDNK